MTMKLFCQALFALFFVLGFFMTIYVDIHGRKAKEPQGFRGVVETIIITVVIFFLYRTAGMFTEILP